MRLYRAATALGALTAHVTLTIQGRIYYGDGPCLTVDRRFLRFWNGKLHAFRASGIGTDFARECGRTSR